VIISTAVFIPVLGIEKRSGSDSHGEGHDRCRGHDISVYLHYCVSSFSRWISLNLARLNREFPAAELTRQLVEETQIAGHHSIAGCASAMAQIGYIFLSLPIAATID